MKTMIAWLVLLTFAAALCFADEGLKQEHMNERKKSRFREDIPDEISEDLLLQEMEAMEAELLEKEMRMEENRNSREKRCLGEDISCGEKPGDLVRMPCCAKYECKETAGYWWYQKRFCVKKKSG
uniref:U12-barytoxin-Tl1a n=1 Tax=Trittame loki TaxID=1295018 RepID=ICK6_TRILK|nr:RecName: Full=U12-barytoxin-Tl1a; Short=U12-BATX-Tl1a; AltName: Full=Toxin ICK-6; Flags: Precursor [Trittame loki]